MEVVYTDYSAANQEIKELEQQVNQISQARALAVAIAGNVTSLTGEAEVMQALRLEDYPSAPPETAAELLGCKDDFRRFRAAVSALGNLEAYEVRKGAVSVSKAAIDAITEKHSAKLGGDQLKLWRKLEALAASISELGSSATAQVLTIGRDGRAKLDYQRFKLLTR